ncbi:MAG: MFS transporter [bacterium]
MLKHRVLVVLPLSLFTAMVGLGIIAPIMPMYIQSLGATGIWLGVIFAGFSLSRLIFMPLIGRLSDRRGRKIFLCLGLLMYALVSLGYLAARGLYQLAGIRLLHGFSSAMVIPIGMAYIGEISPEGKEGSYLGIFNLSLLLGWGSGPLVGGFLVDSLGIASAFYALGCLSALALVLIMIFLPGQQNWPSKSLGRESTLLSQLLRIPSMRAIMSVQAAGAAGRGAIMAFLPVFAESLGIEASRIGLLVSVNILLAALLQGPFGKIADRYSKVFLVVLGTAIASCAIIMMPLAPSFLGLLILGIVMGAGGGISRPAVAAIGAKLGRSTGMGTTMGLLSSGMSIGFIVGSTLGGLAMDLLGLASVFYLVGGLGLIGTFIFYQLMS